MHHCSIESHLGLLECLDMDRRMNCNCPMRPLTSVMSFPLHWEFSMQAQLRCPEPEESTRRSSTISWYCYWEFISLYWSASYVHMAIQHYFDSNFYFVYSMLDMTFTHVITTATARFWHYRHKAFALKLICWPCHLQSVILLLWGSKKPQINAIKVGGFCRAPYFPISNWFTSK